MKTNLQCLHMYGMASRTGKQGGQGVPPWFLEGGQGVSPWFLEGGQGVPPWFLEGGQGVSPWFSQIRSGARRPGYLVFQGETPFHTDDNST